MIVHNLYCSKKEPVVHFDSDQLHTTMNTSTLSVYDERHGEQRVENVLQQELSGQSRHSRLSEFVRAYRRSEQYSPTDRKGTDFELDVAIGKVVITIRINIKSSHEQARKFRSRGSKYGIRIVAMVVEQKDNFVMIAKRLEKIALEVFQSIKRRFANRKFVNNNDRLTRAH